MEPTIITAKTFNQARTLIKKAKTPIIFTSDDDNLNRQILEKEKINTLLLNQKNRKDFSKQRNSGLNQVLVKIAKKNKIAIGINLDELIESQGKLKSKIISRIKQNIKLCNKNKVKMQFITIKEKNKRNHQNLKTLGLSLGMPTNILVK